MDVSLILKVSLLQLAGVANQLGQLGGYATRITDLLTVTKELAATEAAELAAAAQDSADAGGNDSQEIGFDGLTVATPTGAVLVRDLTLRVPPGKNLLVTGPNGAGKSSLFRVLGGLWQPAAGRVIKPRSGSPGLSADIVYVPQRPYVSVGTLREQLTYPLPADSTTLPEGTLRALLERVELTHLMSDAYQDGVETVVDWGEVLSLGEQQRLGLARVFHAAPRIAILDECTSAVTMAMEQKLCAELRTGGCSCVTISHRPALVAVHHLNLALDGQGGFAIKELHQHAGVPGQQAEEEGEEEGRLLAQAPPASAAAENRRSPSVGSPPAAIGGGRAQVLRRILSLPGVWSAEGGRMALLVGVIICRTALSDRIAHLNGETMRHIIGQDRRQFITLLGGSIIQAAAQAVLAPSMVSLAEAVALSWRARLTSHISDRYFAKRGYYSAPNLHGLGDADQRITEDVPKLTTNLAGLFPGLLKPAVDIAWFSLRMLQLTGRRGVALLYLYMFFGLGCLRLVAPDLGAMEAKSSQLEGEFRHTHSRLRAHAESVAFCGGGPYERRAADGRFASVASHARMVLRRKWGFGMADHFLTKELPHNVTWGLSMLFVLSFGDTLGDLQRQGDLGHDLRFLATTVSHSFNAFGELLDLYKKVDELGGHATRVQELLQTLEQDSDADGAVEEPNAGGEAMLELAGLTVTTPDGSGLGGSSAAVLARELSLGLEPRQNLLITGPNGSGKSALARVVCGLWAPGSGGVRLAPGMRSDDLVYVPQRAYLTVGSLREQLTYPYRSSDPRVASIAQVRHGISAEEMAQGGLERRLEELLDVVGLRALLTRSYEGEGEGEGAALAVRGWEAETKWEAVLSLGEQQRLGMARLFFRKPRVAILDEATNATSVDIEDRLYQAAAELGITCVTISQRPALTRYHTRELKLTDGKGDWRLCEVGSLRQAEAEEDDEDEEWGG